MDKTLPPILIIGGGLAGVFCALKLAPHPVAILAPGNIGASGASYWAQGGIAAAVEENDSPEKHTADTIAAGAGLVDPDIALTMTRDARKQIDTLITMGAPLIDMTMVVYLPPKRRRIVIDGSFVLKETAREKP